MPTYEFYCETCDQINEIRLSILDNSKQKCANCKHVMERKISLNNNIIIKQNTTANHKEKEHTKKVKDFERAVKNRKKAFGTDAVGNPNDKPNQMHIVKRGKTLGGQQMEVDKTEMVKALAKDPAAVKAASEALKKSKSK